MSSYGSRTTPLVQLTVDKVINYTDEDRVYFDPQLHIFIRVGPWELDASIHPKRSKGWVFIRNFIRTPIFVIDWSFDNYPTHQYSGDYTERTEERRREL